MTKDPWISFKCNIDFFFVVGYWICEFSFRLFMYIDWDYFQIAKEDSNNEYLYLFFWDISDLLALFWLIKYIKKDKKIEYASKNKISPKIFILILVGLSCLDLFAKSLFYVFHKIFDLDNEKVSQKFARDFLIVVDIIFRIIFNLYRNKKDFFKHKIFAVVALIIIIIILIVLDIVDLNAAGNYKLSDCFNFILILSPRALIFPFVDTIAKKLMEDKYMHPMQYMYYRGVIELILLGIITPILLFTSALYFSSDIFSINLAIVGPIYTIASAIKSALLLNVINKFSSQSVAFLIISESLAGAINDIINFIKGQKDTKGVNITISIFEIILVILIGITTMIYEEIIVIRICGMQKNVKEEIDKRGKDDVNQCNMNNESDEALIGSISYSLEKNDN